MPDTTVQPPSLHPRILALTVEERVDVTRKANALLDAAPAVFDTEIDPYVEVGFKIDWFDRNEPSGDIDARLNQQVIEREGWVLLLSLLKAERTIWLGEKIATKECQDKLDNCGSARTERIVRQAKTDHKNKIDSRRRNSTGREGA